MSAAFKALASKDEYQVAFISPLPIELAAAIALLDERHAEPLDFSPQSIDKNTYTWGRIHEHNVVITSLPAGKYGIVSANTTVLRLLASLPSIKIGLLVGIGAGIPESGIDIRLGDIAVARPEGISGGVVQYDTGKAKTGKGWERTGMLAAPSDVLLNALAKLQAEHEIGDSQVVNILEEAGKRNAKFAEGFKHPGVDKDHLYEEAKPEYHANGGGSVIESLVIRPERSSTVPNIHYGIIASGNILVKDAGTRRAIVATVGQTCICLEMEAAGLINNFPCLVIRGICDYADVHKNDDWQRYASATAAAFAKELLLYVRKSEMQEEARIKETIEQLQTIQTSVNKIETMVEQTQQDNANTKVSKFLRALYTCPYAERKDRNISRVNGTCEWFTQHDLYTYWLQERTPNLLWVSAEPGCGKSVLAKYLVDEALAAESPNTLICYFFFKEDYPDQKSSARAASAFLRQLLFANRDLLHQSLLDKYAADGDKYIESFTDLWRTFIGLSQQSSFDKVICVLDALDECQDSDRQQLVDSLCSIFSPDVSNIKVRVLATSRPYIDIKNNMLRWQRDFPIIHLSGDNEKERNQIEQEIKIVISQRIHDFVTIRGLSTEDEEFLVDHFMAQRERTYLWINLFLKSIEDEPSFARGQVKRASKNIPTSLNQAYNKILNRSPDTAKTKLILQIIMAARRPLLLGEISVLLCLNGSQRSWQDLEHDLAGELEITEIIKRHCSLVVTVVKEKIYINHQTTNGFLAMPEDEKNQEYTTTHTTHITHRSPDTTQHDWRHSIKSQEANREIALRCLWFLKLMPLTIKDKPDLYKYCARAWLTHFGWSDITDPKTTDLSIRFCDPNAPYLEHWFPFYLDSRPGIRAISRSPLMLLSMSNQRTALERLLTRSKQLVSQKRQLSEALWWAVSTENAEVCQLLLKHGADPNTTNSGLPYVPIVPNDPNDAGEENSPSEFSNEKATNQFDTMSALHEAIKYKSDEIVSLLLESGANVNAQDCEGNTPLFLATEGALSQFVARLIEFGADPAHTDTGSTTALNYLFRRWSGYKHNGSECILIFDQLIGYEPNFWDLVDRVCKQVVTSCFDCADHLLRYAIEASKTQNKPNTTGKTLLHLAIYLHDIEMVEKLLEMERKSPSEEENQMCKLLNWALELPTKEYNLDIIDLLISNGADIDYRDTSGRNYLHNFVRSLTHFGPEKLDVIFAKLLAISPDINLQDNLGYTPLMIGILDGPADSMVAPRVQLLLDHGADYVLSSLKGETAYDLVLEGRCWQTKVILEDWTLKELQR